MMAVRPDPQGSSVGLHGFSQLPRQRCKRARCDANVLTKEFEKKLSMSAEQQTGCEIQKQLHGRPGMVSPCEGHGAGSSTEHMSQTVPSSDIPSYPTSSSTAVSNNVIHSRHSETANDWCSTQISDLSSDTSNSNAIVGDEFEEELNYLVGQVQVSGSSITPAQAMPYIF